MRGAGGPQPPKERNEKKCVQGIRNEQKWMNIYTRNLREGICTGMKGIRMYRD